MARKEIVAPILGLEYLIHEVREEKVILDADLARIYGVPTYRFNEAFKRNRHRFPGDFAFQLTAKEFANLRSQAAKAPAQRVGKQRNAVNSSQFAMSSALYTAAADSFRERRREMLFIDANDGGAYLHSLS